MSACIAIGRHLSNLLRVAYGHRLANMRMILARVWGPLFIKVEVADDLMKTVSLTEPQKVEAAIEVSFCVFGLSITLSWAVTAQSDSIPRFACS